jgi:hypothetical protein
MKCLNYEHLRHIIKDYPKPIEVMQYLQEGDFVAKTSVAKLGPNLISFLNVKWELTWFFVSWI